MYTVQYKVFELLEDQQKQSQTGWNKCLIASK